MIRLFRINKYYDSLAVIGKVVENRKSQLMSSLFIIIVMMLTSALILYNIEQVAEAKKMEQYEKSQLQKLEKQYCPYCGKKLD